LEQLVFKKPKKKLHRHPLSGELNLIQVKSETSAANLLSSENLVITSNHSFAEFSPSLVNKEGVVQSLKTRLKLLNNIESVWYEEMGNEIYVYFDASKTDRATLRPIFAVQYALEDDFPQIAFHFRVDSQELENRKTTNHLIRLI